LASAAGFFGAPYFEHQIQRVLGVPENDSCMSKPVYPQPRHVNFFNSASVMECSGFSNVVHVWDAHVFGQDALFGFIAAIRSNNIVIDFGGSNFH
jgi:hypothetical protein